MQPDTPNPKRPVTVRGRGALDNPSGRFERVAQSIDEHAWFDEEEARCGKQVRTQVFKDTSRSIVATNDSPDIGMEATVNPYRGCEHGCIYCYARPGHEYFGLSAGLDFETKIFVKEDAPRLLAQKLSSKNWQPQVVTLSGVTDCYQPLERSMKITRGCLEVLRDFRNPAVIITKNNLVTRDIDVLAEMAAYECISVNLSVTTLDGGLARIMEPRTSQPAMRLRAIEALAKAGIPVGVMIGPVLPGLTEHEIPAILKAVAGAGATRAHYTMLRLPYGVKDLFVDWLDEHFPDRKEKILNRLRSMRNGKLYDAEFGTRMRGTGFYADQIAQIFNASKKRYGLDAPRKPLSTAHFRRDAHDAQQSLF